MEPSRRDGVSGGGTQRQTIELTGETQFGPAEENPSGREAYEGETRKRGNEAGHGVGGGQSTDELRENRRKRRAATFGVVSSQLNDPCLIQLALRASPPDSGAECQAQGTAWQGRFRFC
jgi:hypothetical protein